jgi:hypothetical protein
LMRFRRLRLEWKYWKKPGAHTSLSVRHEWNKKLRDFWTVERMHRRAYDFYLKRSFLLGMR